MNEDNKKTNETILEMYKQGYSCKDIALLCNVPLLSIRQYLQASGFDTRAYRKISYYNKDKVLLLVKAGYSYKQIEQLLYVSTHVVREIISENGLIGFSPKYHHPIQLDIKEDFVSMFRLKKLRQAYLSGKVGLSRCAVDCSVTDEEFLWFVYHLSEKDKAVHREQMLSTLLTMHKEGYPAAAIAKSMDISLSLVKKEIKRAV